MGCRRTSVAEDSRRGGDDAAGAAPSHHRRPGQKRQLETSTVRSVNSKPLLYDSVTFPTPSPPRPAPSVSHSLSAARSRQPQLASNLVWPVSGQPWADSRLLLLLLLARLGHIMTATTSVSFPCPRRPGPLPLSVSHSLLAVRSRQSWLLSNLVWLVSGQPWANSNLLLLLLLPLAHSIWESSCFLLPSCEAVHTMVRYSAVTFLPRLVSAASARRALE